MPEQPAPWNDEAFAGTLFPAARPIPAQWISTDYEAVAPAADFRAMQEARVTAREARRQAAASPEADEAAWRQAREQARHAMRRERQQERIAAGVEDAPPDPDYARWCEKWVEDIDGAMLPALQQMAQSLASIDVVARWQEISAAINAAAAIPAPLLSTTSSSSALSAQEMERVKASLANGGWLPPGHDEARQRAGASMATPSAARAPAAKARPERERYLPGTRHARRH